ncbi:AMP-binding protein [Actinophytocola xanthii]|uniref:AMP-dependent synthetase n=1 Tax=Actinophytocola xanthii TaxID=1912961 RepID=A0A1Q8CK12_9PSEU|nr:AMP-binding protein [Actinophytocola xanthii]OLF14686.1 hypothetical protein BU204_25685 [Actinophytocola xanthii]
MSGGGGRTPAHEEFRAARDLLIELREDHDRACELFRWPRPRYFNWALDWFDVVADGNDAPALVLLDAAGGETEVSFAALARRSDAVAHWFGELGVRRGERMLVALDQRSQLWVTLLACLKAGVVVIPTYTTLTATEAADRLDRGEVCHVVCEPRLVPHFAGGAHVRTRTTLGASPPGWHDLLDGERAGGRFVPTEPTSGDAVAFCYFTSGTTTAPKLVAHTHLSYPVGHLSGMYWAGLLPGDRHLNVAAPGWAKHSWSSLFAPWNAEATVVALPAREVAATRLPGLLDRHRVTTFCAPPSVWRAMLPAVPAHRPGLREALSAGEPLDAHTAAVVRRAWGVRVRDGYGQTETTGLVGTTPGLPSRPGWLGKALPGYRISLRDPGSGERGDEGEVGVDLDPAPVGVMHGYLGSDAPSAGPDGWYGTGDLGERSADGWLRIHGRRDEVFKSFDHRISPYELEAVLRGHPAVADAAVVPRPHPVGGAVPHAVVEPVEPEAGGPELERELLDHVAARVAGELRVRSVDLRRRLPRTASGKVRRADLRAEIVAGTSAGPSTETRSFERPRRSQMDVQQRSVAVWKDLLTGAGRDAVPWQRWVEPGRAGVDIHRLYRVEQTEATAFLVRFGPGAHGDLHEHLDYELMFVLDGELCNDNGDRYGVGDLVVEEPHSVHRVSSEHGCTLLVVREAATRPVAG